MYTRLIAGVVTSALAVVPVAADKIFVPGDYPTIQEAIVAADQGDEIIVAEGVYVENIDFLGKAITVRSTNPSNRAVVDATIVDGGQAGTVVTLTTGVIRGFTIRNGRAEFGGGVYATGAAVLSLNTIAGNVAAGSGGGVYALHQAVVTDNVIADNEAERFGGGLYAAHAATVSGNAIRDNTARSRGGGAYLIWRVVFADNIVTGNQSLELGAGGVKATGDVLITGCFIDNNHANSSRDGGGVQLGEDCILEACTISNNSAFGGGGVSAYGRSVIRNNLIMDNSAETAAGAQLGGNINSEIGVLFARNFVSGNQANQSFGGLSAYGRSVVVDNVVTTNVAPNSASAIGLFDETTGAHNTVTSNSAGIRASQDATVVSNIVAFSISDGGLSIASNYAGLMDHNCVFGNVGGDYLNGAVPGPHDVNEDPLLRFGDYHLTPNSPCINVGFGDSAAEVLGENDIDNERRVQSCNVDIGADEYSGEFTAVLSVSSSLPSGAIEVSPADCSGEGDGIGSFNRFYTGAESVTLTVEDTDGFVRWVVNGIDQPQGNPSVTVDMSADVAASAIYSIINVPKNSPTIQEAIDAAVDGTTIIVAQGTYFEDIDFLGKNITVRSTDPMDAEVVAATIIDGSPPDTWTVQISAGEISGFTITNGGRGVDARGIAVVSRNVISDHDAYASGVGVLAQEFTLISNNIITRNNSENFGAGVFARNHSRIIGNVILYNTAASFGGGVYVDHDAVVVGNTIVANAALGSGGGIYAIARPTIANNIVAFSTLGGGIDAGLEVSSDYNCVFGNAGGDYVGDLGPGPNDINADPLLDFDGIHLLPESPCIDAGDTSVAQPGDTDIDGQMRVWAAAVDIGADEFGSFVPGDINCDGDINALDIEPFLVALFDPENYAARYPDCNLILADINRDGIINALDIEPFLGLLFP